MLGLAYHKNRPNSSPFPETLGEFCSSSYWEAESITPSPFSLPLLPLNLRVATGFALASGCWWTDQTVGWNVLAWTGLLLSSCPRRKNTSQPDSLAPQERRHIEQIWAQKQHGAKFHLLCLNPAAPQTFQKTTTNLPFTPLCIDVLLLSIIVVIVGWHRCYNGNTVCFLKKKESATFQRYILKYLQMKKIKSF